MILIRSINASGNKLSGINALPCGIKAEPTVDEVNYQAYSLAGSIYAPDDKERKSIYAPDDKKEANHNTINNKTTK